MIRTAPVRSIGLAVLAALVLVAAPAGASSSLTLSGSSSDRAIKPKYEPCAPGVPECGVLPLAGLGPADWEYVFGPTFEPDGRCYDVDGTFTLTLRSDSSTITGSVTGSFCPKPSGSSGTGAAHSWGNPFVESDTIAFSGGTGQFAGLEGSAVFSTVSAGARFQVSLQGTLTD